MAEMEAPRSFREACRPAAQVLVVQAHMRGSIRHPFPGREMIAGERAWLRGTPWWSSVRIEMSRHQLMNHKACHIAGHLRKCVFGRFRLRDLVAAAGHIKVPTAL
jgi:hypothetical protein